MTGPVRITARTLADGRGIVYVDRPGAPAREAADARPLDPFAPHHRMRLDPVLGSWVSVASHRQTRTFLPADDQCPLCPSRPGRPSEVPEASYEVVVFENRFPSFAAADDAAREADPSGLLRSAAAQGRCEVVCFTDDHQAGFADLDDDRIDLVLTALTERTAAIAAVPGVRQVFPFENRGEAIGVTLRHPHGQIYGYPFVTPRTARALEAAAAHRTATGRNLFDDVLGAELADGSRVVLATEHWVAFVPFAARYPVEVHLYPRRRTPDLVALADDDPAARDELAAVLGDLLRRGDAFYEMPLPYIAAWHQGPVRADDGRAEAALHLELFSVQRAPDKLKYLAGSESAMDAFIGDRAPEDVAARLRALGPGRARP